MNELEQAVQSAEAQLASATAQLAQANDALGAVPHVDVSGAWLATREHQEYWLGRVAFSGFTDGAEMVRALRAEQADADAIAAAEAYQAAVRAGTEVKELEARRRQEAEAAARRVDSARGELAQASVRLRAAREEQDRRAWRARSSASENEWSGHMSADHD